MYINPGIIAGVMSLHPQGTNSTLFTECCEVAICNDEAKCPKCKREIIGYNAYTLSERAKIRWKYATKHWRNK
jgi:hypothetical protein